ncbi:hypothetical protein A3C28_00265 [Candidatus Roizmanbacteria bacterium RIFCSPHIGHO2_02_FULL_39_9]|nr:MAG: hypothetical protein A3C28_00265 [Candidatus Roizmanbacteria bacterium RIFCSPHIGHO2_02_FULL_39_9]
MKTKLVNPKRIVDFMILAGKLKWLKRTGWINAKMPDPETVAEHTFRVTILSRILAPLLGLDVEKLTIMAIFHDFAEGIFGDPILESGRRKVREYSWKDESKFMEKVFKDLNMPNLYLEWKENILENGPQQTIYSDSLYQIGKLANAWQAFEYELRGVPKEKTNEFWENSLEHIKIPVLRKILNSLIQLRGSGKI